MILLDEKMPESCEYCLLSHYYPESMTVWCNLTGSKLAENYNPMSDARKIPRPKTCLLKEQKNAEWTQEEKKQIIATLGKIAENVGKAIGKRAEELTCEGCRYQGQGRRFCDGCRRSYFDRYKAKEAET